MSNIILLIKYYFLIFLGNLTSKKNVGKVISGGIVFLLISALMIGTFTYTAIMTTKEFVELSEVLPGAEEMAMFSNLIIGLLLIFLFTVMRSIYPSKHSDNEMLLALPITKTQIIVAKAFYNCLFDIASYAMVLLPSFIVYYIIVPNTSFMVVVWGVIFVLLAAIFSSAVSYMISLVFLKLASKFKNVSLIQSSLTLICLAGYIIIQYSIPRYLSDFNGELQEYLSSFWLLKILFSWILRNNILIFLAILVSCIIIYLVSLLLRTYYFSKEFKVYQHKNKKLKYQPSKTWLTLFKKEFKFYFGNSVYFINTIIGVFFLIGISIAYRIIGRDQVFAFMSLLPSKIQISQDILIIVLSCMILTTTITTSVSVSLEGKHLWILKAHPIKIKDIFISKILVNVLVSIGACFISSCFFADYEKPLTLFLYFVIPLLCSINTSIIGLIINLIFPKLEFDSIEAVVKRSISYPLSVVLAFVLALIPVLVYLVVGNATWSIEFFSLICIGIYSLIFITLISILFTKGVKLFKQL